VRPPDLMVLELPMTLPDGTEGSFWATVSRDCPVEVLEALRRAAEAAAAVYWPLVEELREVGALVSVGFDGRACTAGRRLAN
jgi:hypothetical protein